MRRLLSAFQPRLTISVTSTAKPGCNALSAQNQSEVKVAPEQSGLDIVKAARQVHEVSKLRERQGLKSSVFKRPGIRYAPIGSTRLCIHRTERLGGPRPRERDLSLSSSVIHGSAG